MVPVIYMDLIAQPVHCIISINFSKFYCNLTNRTAIGLVGDSKNITYLTKYFENLSKEPLC